MKMKVFVGVLPGTYIYAKTVVGQYFILINQKKQVQKLKKVIRKSLFI